MEDLNAQIKKLQETIQVLIKRYKQLQKENERLQSEQEILEKKVLQKDALIETIQDKSTAANLASLYSVSEKKILQQKIDFYLKNIEKCLSLLNA